MMVIVPDYKAPPPGVSWLMLIKLTLFCLKFCHCFMWNMKGERYFIFRHKSLKVVFWESHQSDDSHKSGLFVPFSWLFRILKQIKIKKCQRVFHLLSWTIWINKQMFYSDLLTKLNVNQESSKTKSQVEVFVRMCNNIFENRDCFSQFSNYSV